MRSVARTYKCIGRASCLFLIGSDLLHLFDGKSDRLCGQTRRHCPLRIRGCRREGPSSSLWSRVGPKVSGYQKHVLQFQTITRTNANFPCPTLQPLKTISFSSPLRTRCLLRAVVWFKVTTQRNYVLAACSDLINSKVFGNHWPNIVS